MTHAFGRYALMLAPLAFSAACASPDTDPAPAENGAGASGGGVSSLAEGSGGTLPDPDPDPPDPGPGGAGGGGGAGGAGSSGGDCPCYDGDGTYCTDTALAHGSANGCTVPRAKDHPGDVLFCDGGKWTWNTACSAGCNAGSKPAHDHCEKIRYELPWKCDSKKYCTAGNAEAWHHQAGTSSEFAFDFSMATGTKVRAARGGVVMIKRFITEKGDPCYNGCDASPSVCASTCGNAANAVIIKHDDGTAAAYLHLSEPYPGVKKNARVELGQPIALSGSTGWSTGPHLHFQAEVKGCSTWYCDSIPANFDGIGKPDAGDLLTSKNCP